MSTIAAEWFADRVTGALRESAPRGLRVVLVERSISGRGLMAPLHAHEDDASYYVLSGRITFHVGDEVVPAGAGDVVVVPADTPHTFRVDSDRARFHVLARVSSPRALQDFGQALAAPADGWTSEDEAVAVAALAAPAGITVLGPPGALPASL